MISDLSQFVAVVVLTQAILFLATWWVEDRKHEQLYKAILHLNHQVNVLIKELESDEPVDK